jgi:dolichol-phosphate mannosyltransferase
MRANEDRRRSERIGTISLILPKTSGSTVAGHEVAEYRRILEEEAGIGSVEVIISSIRGDARSNGQVKTASAEDNGNGYLATHAWAEAADWPSLVRAGLGAATGEYLVVLDLDRPYAPGSLIDVIRPVRTSQFELAIAVPQYRRLSLANWMRSRLGSALISRMMLGTSDVFSGLFALQRSVWDSNLKHGPGHGSSLVLDSLLRRPARSIDVPVTVDDRFRSERLGWKDLRPVKRILDGRFGIYSRLVQFCIVGASGMVIDLTFYALLQFLLSFTWLADRRSALFGSTWHLAIAAGMSIAIALVWNFTLNRRLTFNDAHKGALLRQFFTYVLSNALAIVLSFSVRLLLPGHFGFFARHRLAAAVVGIVAATGISFSMARWLVFARRPELKLAAHFPLEQPVVGQSSSVV